MGAVSVVFAEKFRQARLRVEAYRRRYEQFAQGLDHVEGAWARRVKCTIAAWPIFSTMRCRHGM
jgi:hypothetical protein